MKKFKAVMDNGREKVKVVFHSSFRTGSILNRGDLISEMSVQGMDREEWKIRKIEKLEP